MIVLGGKKTENEGVGPTKVGSRVKSVVVRGEMTASCVRRWVQVQCAGAGSGSTDDGAA